MRKHFVWACDAEQMIEGTLSDKSKRQASDGGTIAKLFGRVAGVSAHYYSTTATMYELSRTWTNINMSSIYRLLKYNQALCEGVGLIFSSFELQKVLAAPLGSIIVPTFDIGGYGFEIIEPNDPDYLDAFVRLPGAT